MIRYAAPLADSRSVFSDNDGAITDQIILIAGR